MTDAVDKSPVAVPTSHEMLTIEVKPDNKTGGVMVRPVNFAVPVQVKMFDDDGNEAYTLIINPGEEKDILDGDKNNDIGSLDKNTQPN